MKYKVYIVEKKFYRLEVEAENTKEAENEADRILASDHEDRYLVDLIVEEFSVEEVNP